MADVVSPLTGTVARVERAVGAPVDAATTIVVVESMKMEYAVDAGTGGTLAEIRVAVGDAVQPGDVLAVVSEQAAATARGEDLVPAGEGGAGAGRPGPGATATRRACRCGSATRRRCRRRARSRSCSAAGLGRRRSRACRPPSPERSDRAARIA